MYHSYRTVEATANVTAEAHFNSQLEDQYHSEVVNRCAYFHGYIDIV